LKLLSATHQDSGEFIFQRDCTAHTAHGRIIQKTAEVTIMKFLPYGSQIPLVSAG